MREQGCDWFLLCCTERISIRDVQFAFVSPEKEGLISSYLSPYTKETWLAVKWGGDACAKHFEMQKLLKCSLLPNKLALRTAIFFKGNCLGFLHLSIHINKQTDRMLAHWRKRFHLLLLINNNTNSKSMNGNHSICRPLQGAQALPEHTTVTHSCYTQHCPFLMQKSKFLLTVFALPPESSSSKNGKNFGNAWLQLLALIQNTH